MRFETRAAWLALGAAAVPVAIALPLVWFGDFSLKSQITLTLAIVLGTGGFAVAARDHVLRPLQTLANLVGALRERDYSVRGRYPNTDDALGIAMTELAALADALRAERWRDEETAAGLSHVVERLDAAVVAVDRAGVVRIANPTVVRLVGKDPVGAPAAEVGLGALVDLDGPRTVELAGGTWEARPSDVRLAGVPHRLIVMADVRRALRAEERQAWQRLVRVLGHEINNSLGPIASIAETLRTGLANPRPDFDADLTKGLEIIERRAAALARFMQSYTRLVRLPPPRLGKVDIAAWVRRTADLETRLPVSVADGPDIAVSADADQLDQLLINLVRNAVDASPDGGVAIDWRATTDAVVVTVADDGPGVAETANLFVPFFTTKPGGSGIGLVLARQIAEAHGGSLVLRNRGGKGAEAVVTLPR